MVFSNRERWAPCRYGIGEKQPDRNDPLIGGRLIGVSQHYLGDQSSARRRLEQMLAHYQPAAQRLHIISFPLDPQVMARTILARVLWLQGLPDQAVRAAESSIEDARAANHGVSFCYALALGACPIALWVGDLAAAAHYTRMLLDHSRRCSLPLWSALGSRFQSVVDIKAGDLDTGLRLSRTVLDEIAKPDVRLRFFIGLGELAEALGHAGQISDGLAVIEEALAWVESGEGWAISEVLRIKGELVLLQGAAGAAAAAEDHFRQALDWARRQDALSWELRAATSLARLMGDHGRSAEATALLQPVYARFTEGFDTTDLKAAKAPLDTLAEPNALRTRIS
jgi:predicted ATPase